MSHHFSPSVDHVANGSLATASVPYWDETTNARTDPQIPGSRIDQFHLFGRNTTFEPSSSIPFAPGQNISTGWCSSLNNVNIPSMTQTSEATWSNYHCSSKQQISGSSGFPQQNAHSGVGWQNAKFLNPLQLSLNTSGPVDGQKSASSFTIGSNFNENYSNTADAGFSPIRRSCSNTMESRPCDQPITLSASTENGTKTLDSGSNVSRVENGAEDARKYHTSFPSSPTSNIIDKHDLQAARTIHSIQGVEQQNMTTVEKDDQDKMETKLSENVHSANSLIEKPLCEEMVSHDIKLEDEIFDRSQVMDDESSRSTISTHDATDRLLNPSNPDGQLSESYIDNKIQEFMDTRQPAVYTCEICRYTCAQKFHFNSHMNTHTDRKCTMCDYTSRTEGRLKKHMNEAHLPLPSNSAQKFKIEDDTGEVFDPMNKLHQYSPPSPDGYLCDSEMIGDDSKYGSFSLANPNETLHSSSVTHHSSSKPKCYKCKQCQYIAPTKDSFWEHQRSHIKPERLMSCPHCLFVTEYKHHMEYHLRNHSNVKPHKCPKCNYCCVNKSMLNSHLKSHSSVYQYRCHDCSYETKYCHSLKQHLRKHNHRPGKLVNQDGVEQDIQLDVYGNRRGPKSRRNNSNNSSLNAENTSSCSDKDGGLDHTPSSVATRPNIKSTSTRNSPNLPLSLTSPLSLLDASNVANVLAAQSNSNIYQNLLLNRAGICSTTQTNNKSTSGLSSVPFLGAGGSMGVQLPTVPDLLTAATAAAPMVASSASGAQTNNSDAEKFKQILAAQYLFLLKQQAIAAATAAAINNTRTAPNVAAAAASDNAFLLNGGDAGLIFSSTGYAQGGSVGCNREQQDYDQRVRSRSFIGTLTTSKSNCIKSSTVVDNNGLAPPVPVSSPFDLTRENLKLPSFNGDVPSIGTTSPRCRSRSPICEALKASCSSDDGSGSSVSNSRVHSGSNFALTNGSSRRKGKAFKLVDSIAMRLQSGNSRSPSMDHAENEKANNVGSICMNGSTCSTKDIEENPYGNTNVQNSDLCSDDQNDQHQRGNHTNNNDVRSDEILILNQSHSSIIQQNNQSSSGMINPDGARMVIDGQQRDQSTAVDFSRSYHCSHCGIWFNCQIMYLLHKGCHSSDNPFKCNLCGAACDDRLKFFLHITQAPHEEL